MGILINLIITLGLVIKFISDFIVQKKEPKKVWGSAVLMLAVIGVWCNYLLLPNTESHKLSRFLDEIKAQNKTMQEQNDSLKQRISEFQKRQVELNLLGRMTVDEMTKSRTALEAIRAKAGPRLITAENKQKMISILSPDKGSYITVTSILGDNEGFQFATQVKDVLNSSGWKVNGVNQGVFTQPISGIVIFVKNERYPIRVNTIVKAFSIIGLMPYGSIDNSLSQDDVQLVIGAQ